jgi:integrase
MSLDGNPLTDRQTFPFEVERNPLREVATENRFEKTRAVSDNVVTGTWVVDSEDPEKHVFRSQRSHLSEVLDLAHHTGRRISSVLALTFADLRLQRTSEAPHGFIHWSQDSDKMAREWLTPISAEVRTVLEGILRERPAIGSHPLFPSVSDPERAVAYRVVATWLRKAEALAGLEPLRGALWHAYRRTWASERKHLPDVDVAEMGGWSCVDTLKIYQRPDAETRQRVLTDRRPIREVS